MIGALFGKLLGSDGEVFSFVLRAIPRKENRFGDVYLVNG